ncbi:MAG: hypothetical protein Q8O37_16505 [Sulfuricellaceae bacterium]|nr:hypothetical protein [Sulfuricellaceae bacterium]
MYLYEFFASFRLMAKCLLTLFRVFRIFRGSTKFLRITRLFERAKKPRSTLRGNVLTTGASEFRWYDWVKAIAMPAFIKCKNIINTDSYLFCQAVFEKAEKGV